jgi:recombination associated protein RdgC
MDKIMWFKNALVYRLSKELENDLETLESQLAEFSFTPCGSQDKQKFGWSAVIGDSLIHSVGTNLLLKARKEEKILPASVVKDQVESKVALAQTDESRALTKKEKDNIKEEVLIDLLPKAFTKSTFVPIAVLKKQGLVVVDSSSHTKAEEALALLRKSIGSLPVVPAIPTEAIEVTLTNWIKEDSAPANYEILLEAELKSVTDDSVLRAKNQNLFSDEIKQHLELDKLVTKLALQWDDKIEFVLADDGSIKRLKFADELKEENDDIPREDRDARFDADMALICGEFEIFLPDLYQALGGFDSE